MKLRLLAAIFVIVVTFTVSFAHAEPIKLYLTYSTGTIRTSEDGVNWSVFATPVPSANRLRGICCDPNGNVLVFNRDGGTGDVNRTILALDPSGSLITTNIADVRGIGNATPLAYYKGYLYLNGGATGDHYSAWSGTSFSYFPMASTYVWNWQANDMVFVSSGGTDYQYINGTSGTAIRRRTVDSDGKLSNHQGVTITASSGTLPAYFSDLAFSPSGRLLLLGQGTSGDRGIWVSAAGQIGSLNITVTRQFAFTATENPSTGDMGNNARDMVLLGTKIYAVNDSRCYRYTLNDDDGTITFDGSATHGVSGDQFTQITGMIVPEPGVAGAVALAAGLMALRKRE